MTGSVRWVDRSRRGGLRVHGLRISGLRIECLWGTGLRGVTGERPVELTHVRRFQAPMGTRRRVACSGGGRSAVGTGDSDGTGRGHVLAEAARKRALGGFAHAEPARGRVAGRAGSAGLREGRRQTGRTTARPTCARPARAARLSCARLGHLRLTGAPGLTHSPTCATQLRQSRLSETAGPARAWPIGTGRHRRRSDWAARLRRHRPAEAAGQARPRVGGPGRVGLAGARITADVGGRRRPLVITAEATGRP